MLSRNTFLCLLAPPFPKPFPPLPLPPIKIECQKKGKLTIKREEKNKKQTHDAHPGMKEEEEEEEVALPGEVAF